MQDDVTTLYLRGMPRKVVREAKATAARRGTTLATVVSEALERAAGSAEPPSDDLRDDRRWYEANRPRLLQRFRGEYLAIIDGAVVDHDRSFEALAERVFARFDVRSIFMPRVLPGNVPLRVRSPRLVRR